LISKDKREKVHLPSSPQSTKKRPIRVSFFMPVFQPSDRHLNSQMSDNQYNLIESVDQHIIVNVIMTK